MTTPKILITGGSGLIGTNLALCLLEKGFAVISLARTWPLKNLWGSLLTHQAHFSIEGDIRDSSLLDKVFHQYQPTHLVHLAAQSIVGNALANPEETFDINIRGTWLLIEAAQKYGKLKSIIIASSDKAYGSHNHEDLELKACYPYDFSKQAAEKLAMSYYHTRGLPITITRCGNTFGPYDLNMTRIVPGTIMSCLRSEDIIIRSSGLHKRCFVYAQDVADAYLRILTAPEEKIAGQAFNIGNPEATSILDIVVRIRNTAGGKKSQILIKDNAPGEIEHQSLDCRKIENTLGWQQISTLDQALSKTIEWYRAALPTLAHTTSASS